MIQYTFLFTFFLCLCVGCQPDQAPIPKPRGYPKVIYPKKAYQPFDAEYCAFHFEYPVYASIQQDTTFFNERPNHPCWFDVVIPAFDARLHCSYYPIQNNNDFEKLRADAFHMVNKHNMKASYIDEFPVRKPNNVNGFVFNIEGPAASPFQFYLSDSTKHFVRGALYFNTQVQPDSLAPVFDFVKADIMHLVNTLEWK